MSALQGGEECAAVRPFLPPVFDFSINSQAEAGKCAAFPTAETEGKKENKVQMPPSFAGKEGEESRCSHIPKQALIKMEGKHGGGDEMTRRERGKQGILERAAPILQPVTLFFGLLLLLSLVGRSIGSDLIEQIALSFILIAVAADAGFLVSRQHAQGLDGCRGCDRCFPGDFVPWGTVFIQRDTRLKGPPSHGCQDFGRRPGRCRHRRKKASAKKKIEKRTPQEKLHKYRTFPAAVLTIPYFVESSRLTT